jgi:hypothetical protein
MSKDHPDRCLYTMSVRVYSIQTLQVREHY